MAAGKCFATHGFSGTGLTAIVQSANVTKGALFHHFSDKSNMALAWIAEDLTNAMEEDWFLPLGGLSSLDALKTFCRAACQRIRSDDAASALTALSAETSPTDPLLRDAFETLFSGWRGAFSSLLESGKDAGWIHRSIEPESEAAFIVAFLSGLTVAARASSSETVLRQGGAALTGYLETLRAP